MGRQLKSYTREVGPGPFIWVLFVTEVILNLAYRSTISKNRFEVLHLTDLMNLRDNSDPLGFSLI